MANETGKPRVGEEMKKMEVEPLAPIEIKLILGSLVLGLTLLVVLLVLGNVIFPVPH